MKKLKATTKNACLQALESDVKQLISNYSPTLTEQVKRGVVAMYDHSDIYEYDVSEVFNDDPFFGLAMYENLFQSLVDSMQQDEDKDINDYSASELVEIYQEHISNYAFYRLKDSYTVTTLEDALKIIRPVAYWMPIAVMINGEWHSTYHLGAEDEDGNTVGIRF